jgi:hypothetical protein
MKVRGDGVFHLKHSQHAKSVGGTLWSCSWVRRGTCPPLSGMAFLFGVIGFHEKVLGRSGRCDGFWSVVRVAWLCALRVPLPASCMLCGYGRMQHVSHGGQLPPQKIFPL